MDDLAERRRRHAARGPFLSPGEAPPPCTPSGGDRSLIGYRCVNETCPGRAAARASGEPGGLIMWARFAEPRAWGVDRDPEPENGWCPFCGEDGERVGPPEQAIELLRREAPELFRR